MTQRHSYFILLRIFRESCNGSYFIELFIIDKQYNKVKVSLKFT